MLDSYLRESKSTDIMCSQHWMGDAANYKAMVQFAPSPCMDVQYLYIQCI